MIKEIHELISQIKEVNRKERSTKKLVINELLKNVEQLNNAKIEKLNLNQIVILLKNNCIEKAINDGFNFNEIKKGKITSKFIKDKRNNRYVNKDLNYLFNSISIKISILKELSLVQNLDNTNTLKIKRRLSNLFYKMKLILDFIK